MCLKTIKRKLIMDVSKKIKKYVIINAIEHKGIAQSKSVLGKLLSDEPGLRKDLLSLRSIIDEEVEDVNKLSLENQKTVLEKLGGYEKKKVVEKKELQELDIDRKGLVVRFAPNPDGAIHLGNARPAILCYEYVKKYKGKMILRFDDTDPNIKTPKKEYYKWIKEDLKWLGIKWNKEIIQSKRISIYLKYADELVKKGYAYVCECQNWKKYKDKRKPCPCRNLELDVISKRWKNMKSGKYLQGEAVLRIKTDLEARNPALIDWPAMRIVDNPSHPFTKSKIWPLYNFASGIDDHLTEVTHIFRGQEHSTNTDKQRYMYDYFKWKYPDVVNLGRLSMSDMVLSKTTIREGIEKGEYSGWDDIKLGTIKALKRKGFVPKALINIIRDIGPKPNDITISTENLSAYNRKIIDITSDRFYFVADPKMITVSGLKKKEVSVKMHPEKNETRTIKLGNKFYITKVDFEKYKGVEVRLKGLCNLKLDEKSKVTSYEIKSTPKLQWVPEEYIKMRVFMPERDMKGFAEMNLSKCSKGKVVQLERFGFVKIEKTTKDGIIAVYLHD